MFNLITIGDAVLDTHLMIDPNSTACSLDVSGLFLRLKHGTKIAVADSFQAVGGNAANVALASARLGLKTALLTTVGGDIAGKFIIDSLKKAKVNTSLITTEPRAITRYATILNYSGERTILSFHRRFRYHLPNQLSKTNWVYYTGLSEGFEKLHSTLTKYLDKNPDLRLAFNPGSFQLTSHLSLVLDLLPRTALLFVNREEAFQILATEPDTKISDATLIKKLLQTGAEEVVITNGNCGATAGTNESIWHIAPFPVAVVAKTGAGDAFAAAYLTARLKKHPLPTALYFGTANAASVISYHGVERGLLSQNKIRAFVARFSTITPTLLSSSI